MPASLFPISKDVKNHPLEADINVVHRKSKISECAQKCIAFLTLEHTYEFLDDEIRKEHTLPLSSERRGIRNV